MLKKTFFVFLLLSLTLGGVRLKPVHAASLSTLSQLTAGDLIRGESFTAVYYYGEDGFRYVFPNDRTYFTWYSNFDNVKWLSDADMGKLQIGGNVTYKPGVKMIKINTDPKVYAIGEGGELWWVSSESAAVALYGSTWNKSIDDVPDGFFGNYTKTDHEISSKTDFDPADVTSSVGSISADKSLTDATDITIMDNAFSVTSVTINAGETVRVTNNGSNKHTATGDDGNWGSGTISAGGGFWVHRFDKAGTYAFTCSYHPSMKGTIVVR